MNNKMLHTSKSLGSQNICIMNLISKTPKHSLGSCVLTGITCQFNHRCAEFLTHQRPITMLG